MYNYINALVMILILGLITSSCGPQSKTITPLTEADKAGIKNLAIHVEADEELKVDISKMQANYFGLSNACSDIFSCLAALVIDVAYAATDSAIRSHQDSKHQEEMEEDISEIEMDRLLSKSIDEYLESTGAGFEAEITEYQSTSFLAREGYDTLLDITVEEFEVKLCPTVYIYGVTPYREGEGPISSDVVEKYELIAKWNKIHPKYDREITRDLYRDRSANNLYAIDKPKLPDEEVTAMGKQLVELQPMMEEFRPGETVRFWIKFKGQLISTSNDNVIWDREELYYDPKCEYVEDMQNNPELVVNMLTRTIGGIAVNTVNQIQ